MIRFKLKDDIEPQGSSDGFWYDITEGGYIKPEKILADKEELKEVLRAIKFLYSFEQVLIDNDLLNEF